jgi:hypothetical protein
VYSAVAMPHRRTLFIMKGHDRDYGCLGRLGHNLTRLPVPHSLRLGEGGLVRDHSTGTVYAVSSFPVCKPTGIWVWASHDGRRWSGPVHVYKRRMNRCHRDGSYAPSQNILDGFAAARGRLWIGIERQYTNHDDSEAYKLLLIHSRRGRSWSRPARVPHTLPPTDGSNFDTDLRLVANPTTGALHVVFSRLTDRRPKQGGIMHEYFKHDEWSALQRLVPNEGAQLEGVFLSAAGHPIVGYYQW